MTNVQKETVRLADEATALIEQGIDFPGIRREMLILALWKLADIIVLNKP